MIGSANTSRPSRQWNVELLASRHRQVLEQAGVGALQLGFESGAEIFEDGAVLRDEGEVGQFLRVGFEVVEFFDSSTRVLWLWNLQLLADQPCRVLFDLAMPGDAGDFAVGRIEPNAVRAALAIELTTVAP